MSEIKFELNSVCESVQVLTLLHLIPALFLAVSITSVSSSVTILFYCLITPFIYILHDTAQGDASLKETEKT